ncbi:hypothetical protein LI90_1658 [Carbonactinospora thermoautotrophica]|uniref:Uncharacterized protein n=1 Tax=Carbonactinospora thermoautotrophica TaxID=1469144 RepID=A0A132MRX1_9ACTN|nr:hypothetical protein [Carbonactinospora thermoautotrophica]KWX00635.1 hypothetical protein LI90_1658 [Carbonactinospora thermoautotrophica]
MAAAPFGWWNSSVGTSANAVTSDTLTDAGGGTFHDTLVEVELLL